MGAFEALKGKVKQAVADLADDPGLRAEADDPQALAAEEQRAAAERARARAEELEAEAEQTAQLEQHLAERDR